MEKQAQLEMLSLICKRELLSVNFWKEANDLNLNQDVPRLNTFLVKLVHGRTPHNNSEFKFVLKWASALFIILICIKYAPILEFTDVMIF